MDLLTYLLTAIVMEVGDPQQRFTKPQTALYTIRAMYSTPQHRQSGDYKDKNSAIRSGWCCFSDCRCCLRMKSVRHLLTDDRCREVAD